MASEVDFGDETGFEIKPPGFRTWARHLALLFVTFCTVTIAGSIAPFGWNEPFRDANPQTASEIISFIVRLPFEYALLIVDTVRQLFQYPELMRHGLTFSISLLFILTCHEMGHYVACRLYKVDATLPFFIPTPPLIGPAGTFGAFIKILSPLPSRRATFDIGVAGPLAGFLALLPIEIFGVMSMTQLTPEQAAAAAKISGGIYFSDSLLTHGIAWLFGVNLELSVMNAFSSAAWVGILVTALNLTPSGQLDGGHAVYALFGERIHRWTGRIAFVASIILAASGLYFFNSPSGILFAVLLGVMMRIRHPEPLDGEPLDAKRIAIAIITLIVYVLCLTPFPVQVRM